MASVAEALKAEDFTLFAGKMSWSIATKND